MPILHADTERGAQLASLQQRLDAMASSLADGFAAEAATQLQAADARAKAEAAQRSEVADLSQRLTRLTDAARASDTGLAGALAASEARLAEQLNAVRAEAAAAQEALRVALDAIAHRVAERAATPDAGGN